MIFSVPEASKTLAMNRDPLPPFLSVKIKRSRLLFFTDSKNMLLNFFRVKEFWQKGGAGGGEDNFCPRDSALPHYIRNTTYFLPFTFCSCKILLDFRQKQLNVIFAQRLVSFVLRARRPQYSPDLLEIWTQGAFLNCPEVQFLNFLKF